MTNTPVFGAYTKASDREAYVSLVDVSVTIALPKMTESKDRKHG
jgi:hypothetical protein